jgi:Pregnancy-associated plasma protein-A
MRASGGAGDVSPAQIQAQVAVLNRTYSGADANEPAGVAAPNTGVHFVLAGSDEYFNDAWHRDRQSTTYRARTRLGEKNALNIWLVDFRFLGISTFPWDYAGSPRIDGIRVQYNSLPRTAHPAPGYRPFPHFDLGETATHEAGHWLGLFHTFEGGCTSTNDAVKDTPAQASETAGCPLGRDSCSLPGLDPIHNYMDYSYDSCYYEFTPGQAARMDRMWTAYRA